MPPLTLMWPSAAGVAVTVVPFLMLILLTVGHWVMPLYVKLFVLILTSATQSSVVRLTVIVVPLLVAVERSNLGTTKPMMVVSR